jgi:hypothetical protein
MVLKKIIQTFEKDKKNLFSHLKLLFLLISLLSNPKIYSKFFFFC